MTCGRVLECEALRVVARLRPFDLDAVRVERLAFDDGEAVVIAEVEIPLVIMRRALDGHAAFARLDRAVERLLDVFLDGIFGNGEHLQLIADYHGTMLWPMIALSNVAQGSAVFAMIYLQRKNTAAQEINVPACISCYLGVTKPATFGVNLKYYFPFLCGMTDSAFAAIVCVSTSTTANAIGVGGIPGILSIQPQYMPTFALSMLVAICVPFVLTTIVGKRRGIDKVTDAVVDAEAKEDLAPVVAASAEPVKELAAYVDGEVVTLASLNDGVFSAGMVGDGFAIRPATDVVVSPADGTVTVLMEESRHAIGLTLDDGTELLIHIGLDTVAMGGDGFTYLVKQGDRVLKGEPLLRFNRDKIKKAGHPDTVICVVTNPGDHAAFSFPTGGHVEAGKDIVAHRTAAEMAEEVQSTSGSLPEGAVSGAD